MDNMDTLLEDEEIFSREITENRLAFALKAAALTWFALLFLSMLFNIPVYLLASHLPMAQIGFPTCGFLEVWPLSFIGASFFSLLALMKFLSACGAPIVCTWYLI